MRIAPLLKAMKARPDGKILACAPTSDTADIFCLGLAKAGLSRDTMVQTWPADQLIVCPPSLPIWTQTTMQ